VSRTGTNDEQWLTKVRLAVNALLSEPDEISDGLEAELYALRGRLDVLELTTRLQVRKKDPV
jgi:hypothetical protein